MRKAGLDQESLGRNIAGLSPRDRSMMACILIDQRLKRLGASRPWICAGEEKGFLERTQEHPESLILPVLQGIGATAGSQNRYALRALAEGLGAGAGSYMDMAAKQSEIDKRRQETATEAEETRARKYPWNQDGRGDGWPEYSKICRKFSLHVRVWQFRIS